MADENELEPQTDQTEPEQHWTLTATEAIRYAGTEEEARDALLNVVRGTIAHERNLDKIREETERSNRMLEAFKRDQSLSRGARCNGFVESRNLLIEISLGRRTTASNSCRPWRN
jgi:hypothetical protein